MSHAKIILIGEHSVVYGKHAIAMPLLDIRCICHIIKHDTDNVIIDSQFYKGDLNQFKNEAFYHAIVNTFKYINKPLHKLCFKIVSQIPLQRGMGSSAATSIAIIQSIFEYFDLELSNELLYNLSLEAEKIAHTNPSGLDCLLCANQYAYLYTKKQYTPLNLNLDAYLLICDSGIQGKTKDAINIIKENYNQKHIDLLDKYALEMLNAIHNKSLVEIGLIMNNAHDVLKNMHISLTIIDEYITYAQQHSLGAKISGGGLGGCFIVLCTNLKQAQQLKDQLLTKGVPQIWIQKI